MTDTKHIADHTKCRRKRRVSVALSCVFLLLGCLWVVRRSDVVQDAWVHFDYVDSGTYHHRLIRQLKGARSYLDFRLRQNARQDSPQRLALIMAIDETALVDDAMYRHSLRESRQYGVMTPVRAFYGYAKSKGVAIFFVSARGARRRDETEKWLQKAGYRQWNGLFLIPKNTTNVSQFKQQQRAYIERIGYKIILNIGTNPLDLRGENAELPVLLPVPYRLY